MRSADAFFAGAVAGAVAVWLWGDELQRFIGARARDAREQTADAIEALADSIRA